MEHILREATKKLWDKQNQHTGDRFRLFRAVAKVVAPQTVLYAGSYIDIAPSSVFPNVTYVDMDRRANTFFEDEEGVQEIVAAQSAAPANKLISFIHADYTKLILPEQSFDLLVSLYGGFISHYCTKFLKVGGHLMVNPSHGDAALASIDGRYRLAGVVAPQSGDYRVLQTDLAGYMQPKKPGKITRERLFSTQRGIAYTRPAFAYIFERVA